MTGFESLHPGLCLFHQNQLDFSILLAFDFVCVFLKSQNHFCMEFGYSETMSISEVKVSPMPFLYKATIILYLYKYC